MPERPDKIANLIFALNRAGLTCAQIGAKIGKSESTVFAWRNNSTEPKFWAGVALVEMAESVLEKRKTLEQTTCI